jgi:hypothetical protein
VISNQLSIEKRKRMAKNQMVQQLTWVQPWNLSVGSC